MTARELESFTLVLLRRAEVRGQRGQLLQLLTADPNAAASIAALREQIRMLEHIRRNLSTEAREAMRLCDIRETDFSLIGGG